MTREAIQRNLDRGELIVDIGQISKPDRRWLDRLAKSGALERYRGHWDTLSPTFGLGPLKMIFYKPGVYVHA